MMFNPDPSSIADSLPFSRRTLLTMAAASLLAACSSGSGTTEQFQATFLQPWQNYETLSVTEWRRRLKIMHDMGCSEIILQWSAIYGGTYPWTMPDTLIQLLFDEGGAQGIGIRVGLPYDESWWNALSSSATQELPAFLANSQARCIETLEASQWPAQAGFRGWYLPYELDQYNWAAPERRALLLPWLNAIAAAARKSSAQPLALSTFYSTLPTPGTLTGLWTDILDQVSLRPMLQDGAGVSGLGNYASLEPLGVFLRDRAIPFDLIVELFQQLPPLPNTNNAFHAKAATSDRISAQLAIARTFGAERIVAFAIDPWLLTSSDNEVTFPYSWGAQV